MTTELEKYQAGNFNILCPMTRIEGLSEWHKVVCDTVKLSPNKDDGDVYPKAGDAGSFILTGQALQKLAICANVIWNPKETKATVLQGDYVAYNAVGCIRKADGQLVCFQAEYDIDMRVVEDEIRQGWESKLESTAKGLEWLNKNMPKDRREAYVAQKIREEINFKRKHKTKLAATGAKNRVIRALLSVKKSYTAAELQKEFVTPRVIIQPDYKDPDVKKAMMQIALGSMVDVYGPQPAQLEEPPAFDIPPEDYTTVTDDDMPMDPDETPTGDETPPNDFENADVKSKILMIEKEAKRTGFSLKVGEGLTKPLSEFKENHLNLLYAKLVDMDTIEIKDDDIPF